MAERNSNGNSGYCDPAMDLSPTLSPNACIKSSNLLQSKFLQLPSEVRCTIYSFCLVSPSSIVVWAAIRSDIAKALGHLVWDRQATVSSTQNLALGLLHCSTTVATESAQIFYSKNSFRFQRANQSHVIAWPINIDDNRNFLASVEIALQQRNIAWRRSHGSCAKLLCFDEKDLASHPAYLAPPKRPYQEGQVDITDPTIKTIISLLAKRESHNNHRVMTCYLGSIRDVLCDMALCGLGFPSTFSSNSVQIWRTIYFSDTNNDAMDVVWKAGLERDVFYEKRDSIEELGWNIFDVHEHPPGDDCLVLTVSYWMKRTGLTGEAIAPSYGL